MRPDFFLDSFDWNWLLSEVVATRITLAAVMLAAFSVVVYCIIKKIVLGRKPRAN